MAAHLPAPRMCPVHLVTHCQLETGILSVIIVLRRTTELNLILINKCIPVAYQFELSEETCHHTHHIATETKVRRGKKDRVTIRLLA